MNQSTSFAQVAINLLNVLQGHTKGIRLLLVMFLTLTVSAEVWGADVTVKWTASSGALGSNIGSGTIKTGTFSWDYTRTLKSGSTYTGWTSNCIQLGKNGGVENITFTTSAIPGTIKSVSVECSSYNNAHKVSIKVGNNTYLSSTATAKWTTISTKTGSGTSSGQIVISFTDGSRALYIKSISVTYEEAATCTTNPTVSAGGHSNITSTTATVSCLGGITSLGSAGCSITSYGFVYGTSSNPTISNTKVQVGTTYATTGTAFSKELTGLTANTTYYVRPYATNGNGTAYGTQTSFKTLELPKYIVTLKDDNSTLTQSTAGGSVTLPPRNGCDGYTFVGWTKSWSVAQTTWTTTAPDIVPAGSYTPTANVNLYPVYTKTETTPGTTTTTTDYVLTDLASIKSTDVVVITSKNSSGSYYAMSNNNGTSSAPAATSVSVSSNKLSSAPNDNLKWNISNNSGTLTIYPNGKTTTWLYCTSTNNGVRVGTNTAKEFTIDATSGYLNHKGTGRYIGVYNNADWRCYTSVNENIKNQTLAFFVETTTTTTTSTTTTSYISVPDCTTEATVTLDLDGGSFDSKPDGWEEDGNNYTKTANSGDQVTLPEPNKTGHDFEGWYNASTKVTSPYTLTGNTTLTAHWTPQTYDITYKDQGDVAFSGTHENNYPTQHTYGTATTLKSATKSDFNFLGWFTTPNCSSSAITQLGATDYTGNITLYAKWEVAKTATSLSWSAATYSATIDVDNTFPELIKSPADLSPIAYSSSNTGVATIDANGDITLVAAGTTTITATFTETATHTCATAFYTLTVNPSNCRWVEVTDNTTLEDGDEVVVMMAHGTDLYALPYDKEKASNSNPVATPITLDYFAGTISGTLIWYIKKDDQGNITLSPKTATDKYLTCNASSNAVRINQGENRNFTIENDFLKNTAFSTYLAISTTATPKDWRHYESTNTTISSKFQTLKFYKRECLDASKVWVEGNLTNVTCSPQLPQQLAKDGSITLTFTAANGYELPNNVTVTNATMSWNQATGKLTISNPTDNVMVTVEAVKYYTVTWKPAGGNWSGDTNDKVVKYEADDKIVAPATPTYDCHEFLGWTPAYPADMTMPAENLEFTATWNKLSYTITFKNYDGTVLQTSTVECGETPSYTGATPTREQTAQYTYTFKAWSPAIAPATQDQVYTAQFNQTTRSYTVIWYDGTGNAHKTQTANYNTTVTLPTTNPDPCDDEYPHFIGWTADPITGSTTTQPELVENVKVTGDCDYYPVFAKGEGGSSDYKLVTSAPADWSGTYLIVNTDDKKAWKGSATSDNGAIDVTITNNTITSNATTDNETFTIATMTGGYSIKGTSGKYISGKSGDNTTNYNDAAQLNTISIDNNNNVTITSNTSVLRQNNSSATLFRYYKSSSYSLQHPIQLYKKGSGVNYTSYITTCCSSWTAPTLTYTTSLNAETSQTAQPQLGSGTTYGNATYTSSNPSVLAVDEETGKVTAVSKGTATITVTWEGYETYCSMSATSNTITVNGSYSVSFHSNGGTGTMEPQKADPSTQRIAKLNKNEFIKAGYVFVGWKDASGNAYTDEQENITLTKNITLFAQWAAIVTLNDAGNETTTHPATAGGPITLEDGANACDPYEFVGWTTDATGDWNEGINEPALVATTYTPNAPTTLCAVYKIQSEGNANAFKLSFEGSNGNTYYVDEYSSGSSPLRGYSNITKEEAATFIRTKMYPNDDTRYYVYMEEKGEYLYYNGNFNTTSNTPDENQGWVFHTVGDKIKLQSTYSYDPDYLSFSDRDQETINMGTNASGSEFNMLSAVTSTYVASPLCNQEIEIIFETGNGNFVDNAPATNPLTVSRGDVITLPTCEYPGYEFMGWLKDEQQLDPSDIIGTYYTGDYTVDGVSSTITFYAYYKAIPEEVEFTGKDDVELLMYYYDGTADYYYAVSHAAERGELSSKQNCFNATTWTFTNVGNMQYHIQDETGKYLGAYSNGDNDLILSATPKVWTFTEVNGLWKMVCENSPSRALMYISTGKTFANAAISNEGNGAYSYVTLGICPYPTYTTNPVLTQGFVVTNTAMVTSAAGQKVKAANALTLETRNIELPCTFTISAPNITFYDNTGTEVTQLTSSAASEQFELYFAYKPTAENTMEYPTITIVDDEMKTYTIKNRIYARSLPNTFAVVAKVGGMWYALPSQGLNSTTPPAAYPIEVDDIADPTAVTAVPANADWSLRGVYEASRSDATKDRYVANGDNLVFVNNASPAMALNASVSGNYVLTDAQYANYYQTNPGLYEWTPTTSDLETYTLTNEQRADRTLNVSINTVFGVHYDNKATTEVRFLPIQGRYTPMAVQAVEWKENSVVVMYNGDPAQTASVSVNAGAAQTTELSSAQKDIAVYELTADGLATNPTQQLSITIGSEKVILPIPYIVSGEKTDLALLPGATVAARQEVAKVADLVVLKDAKLTAAGAKGNPYKFRNVTIYGGGKLVIPSDKGFGVASLTLRAGGITDAGKYDYVYPQFELRGTFTNTAGKFYYDYITDYDHWYHLVLPFAGELGSITYPTEFYGANVAANNKGSWQIKRYAGEIRATGNYKAWVDIETDNPKPTATTPGVGYIFWGAPKKVTVNGATARQKWGIQRITMPITAGDAIDAENDKEGGKTISDLGSYEDIANNSGKPNDQGWNLIGNPYMVDLTDMSTSGLHACKLVEVIDPATGKWNGKWDWNDETNIRYLTIPSEHFDTYTAKTVTQAVPLVPGRAFFVQLEGEANGVTFSAANRASLMPQHLAAQNTAVEVETGIVLSSETMQDEVNFWIKDGKTNDYEYNADYPKTPNNTNFNIYGVHAHGDLSWVAISPEIAEESMPIGYQVPAAGTYTLSISETYYSDLLDALYVTDHAMSPELTVDLMNAPYEFSVNQAETNNERFTISLILKSENQGPTTGLENIGVQTNGAIKFIYHDKMFILHNGTIYDATGKQVTTVNK